MSGNSIKIVNYATHISLDFAYIKLIGNTVSVKLFLPIKLYAIS
jgi:hypothetical protein